MISTMCLVLFAKDHWDSYPMIIAANRDEFFERAARPAHFWEEAPHLLAGRDLTSFGTWLGVTKQGRISFVTNKRDMREKKLAAPISRGKLVENFLKSNFTPSEYVELLEKDLQKYEGFNLFVSDLNANIYISNKHSMPTKIESGVHTLSNALWNTSWPKTEKIKLDYLELYKNNQTNAIFPIESFFEILSDTSLGSENQLPDTGIGIEREKLLSSIRISLPGYGTRVSTVIAITKENECSFWEKTYPTPTSSGGPTVHFKFKIEKR
ncbi:MAG: NRDE family protein [Leptospira sp.]|nr:NRDE family protein [Leptospira sp.]